MLAAMASRWFVLACVVGCGRIGFAPLDPFGPPEPITNLNTADVEGDPTLSQDLLEIYFRSTRPGGSGDSDIWTSTRSALFAPWSTPMPVTELNSMFEETVPRLTRDGLGIYVTSSRTGIQEPWFATRATRGAPWSALQLVGIGQAGVSVDATNTVMIISAGRIEGFGGADLYQLTRASIADAWSAPVQLVELATVYNDTTPWLSADGLVLYFSSDRPGVGERDLYRTRRDSTASPFIEITPVAELNTPIADTDPWLTDDEAHIVFARGGNGEDLYEARLTPR
jgi:hypothetical protein